MDSNLSIDPEFKELVAIPDDNGLLPLDYDIAHPAPSYQQDSDDFSKVFESDRQELKKGDVVRSRMAPARQKPSELSVEEFFGDCEKRASASGRVRLTKRLVPDTNEVMVEAWNSDGECIYTNFLPVGDDVSQGSPLEKASITDSMLKTLAGLRSALLPEEFEAASKAVVALDVDLFLQIVRRGLRAA
jgi:hypothetical protein